MSNADAREILARNVISARLALGWSQLDLAARAGLSRATVNMIENGTCDPRLTTIGDVARALGTSPLMLLLQPSDVTAFNAELTHGGLEHGALMRKASGALDPASREVITQHHDSQLPRKRAEAVHVAAQRADGAGLAQGGVVGGAIGAMLGGPAGFVIGALLGALAAAPASPARPAAATPKRPVRKPTVTLRRRTPRKPQT